MGPGSRGDFAGSGPRGVFMGSAPCGDFVGPGLVGTSWDWGLVGPGSSWGPCGYFAGSGLCGVFLGLGLGGTGVFVGTSRGRGLVGSGPLLLGGRLDRLEASHLEVRDELSRDFGQNGLSQSCHRSLKQKHRNRDEVQRKTRLQSLPALDQFFISYKIRLL